MFAVHPITHKPIPIWIANFVINGYGSGAVMSVPGHNENDWNFAIKNNLKIKYVIQKSTKKDIKLVEKKFFPEKGRLINSREFDHLNYDNATKQIKKKNYQKKKR